VQGGTLVLANGSAVNVSATSHGEVWAAARTGYGALGVFVWLEVSVLAQWTMELVTAPWPLSSLLSRDLPALRAQYERLQWYYTPYAGGGGATVVIRANTSAAITTGCWNPAQPLGPPVTPPPAGMTAWPAGTTGCVDVSYRTMTHDGDDASLYTEMELMVDEASDVALATDVLAFQAAVQVRHDPAVQLFTGYRYVAADDITLSPFNGRDTVVLSMIVIGNATDGGNQTEVALYDEGLETVAAAYSARPHPGKWNTFDATGMAHAYEGSYSAFVALRDELDPQRVFSNAYLSRLFGP